MVLTHKWNEAALVPNRLLRYSPSHWKTAWLPELPVGAALDQCSVLCKGKTNPSYYYKIHSVRFLVEVH